MITYMYASSICTCHVEDILLHFMTMRMFWHRSLTLRSSINLGRTMKSSSWVTLMLAPMEHPKLLYRSLQRFCEEHRLVVPHNYYQGSSFEHAGGMGTSTIDHVITSKDMTSNVGKVYMLKMAINTLLMTTLQSLLI